jgi:hypothetical protein
MCLEDVDVSPSDPARMSYICLFCIHSIFMLSQNLVVVRFPSKAQDLEERIDIIATPWRQIEHFVEAQDKVTRDATNLRLSLIASWKACAVLVS